MLDAAALKLLAKAGNECFCSEGIVVAYLRPGQSGATPNLAVRYHPLGNDARFVKTKIMWRTGNLEIKDGRLYVERQCIQLNDIVSATVEQTTRGVRASRIALVHFFCLLVGGIALFPYTLVFAVVMWSLAGGVFMAVSFLRTTCWLVHLNRRSNQQTTVTFSEEADARNFLSALGKPTEGS